MSDGSLLVFGCGVSFVALAGIYVFLRERWSAHAEAREGEKTQAPAAALARLAARETA